MNFLKSIKLKIFLIITITFTMLEIAHFAHEIQDSKKDLERYLTNLNSSSARLLSNNIKEGLYTLNYTAVKDILKTFDNSYFKEIVILNKEGYIFAQRGSDKIVFKKYKHFDKLLNNKAIGKSGYFSKIILADKHLGYLVILNDHNLFNKLLNKKIEKLIHLFLLSILIIVIISYIISHIITRPIKKIISKLQTIKENEYLDIKYPSDDEFGYLCREIEDNHNKIIDINQHLELRIEEEVRYNKDIQEQLFKKEKSASMGEMIGNIAHQWRQPLSIISTNASNVKIQKELDDLNNEEFIKYMDIIIAKTQYLSKTIDDFANFIKGDRKKKVFSLKEGINSFISLVQGTIKSNNIDLILEIDENIKINGYENELTQCLINIFNNAKDVMAEKNIKNKYIFIKAKEENEHAVISIKDNGGGISEEIINKVFDPYFTTKHKSQGTGLGLHMTYNLIVNGMEGSIEVNNKEYEYNQKDYKGAEFIITLPLR